MKEFDFRRAYSELAEPAWKALDDETSKLALRVFRVAPHVRQERVTLDTEWPNDDGGLRAAFALIPSEALARAARSVYFTGHWASNGDHGRILQSDGTYWKFSSYADQILRERLGLTVQRDGEKRGNGAFVEVHQGYLRLCVATPFSLSNHDVGPATQQVYDALISGQTLSPHREGAPRRVTRADWDSYAASCERFAVTLRNALRPTDGSPDFLDIERFMTERSA